jgi:hypothetical protein
MPWDPDRRALENERQRWVMERLTGENQIIRELAVDPVRAYQDHRAAFIRTGDPEQYRLMLEYVSAVAP